MTSGIRGGTCDVQLWVVLRVACIVASVASLAALTLPSTAAASFPGANGKFAVELDGCEWIPFISVFSRTGRDLGAITPRCRYVGEFGHAVSLYDWSPDGQRLLAGQSGVAPEGVITMAMDGSDQRLVPVPSEAHDATFAADAQNIAFLLDGAIWRANVETGERHLLRPALPCNLDVRDCVEFTNPRWSPDGKLIAFESHQVGWGPGGPPEVANGIWLMSARTGKLVRRVARDGYEVDWAPDSSRLVYRSNYQQSEFGGASGGDIKVVTRRGRQRQLLVRRPRVADTSPVWSPDGRWLAWVSLRFGPGDLAFDIQADLWRMRLDGTRPRRLTDLRSPYVEEGFFDVVPRLAWQPVPTANK